MFTDFLQAVFTWWDETAPAKARAELDPNG